jgi:phosphoribosylamine--glycine ligase
MTHVLVVGGGGREHAIAWKLAQSARVTRLSVAPGNAGTADIPIAQNIDIDATDIVSLLDFAEQENANLTVIGPENPLAMGMVDQFEAAGLQAFGPRRRAAMIETSKHYAKELMIRHHVPTAPYELFDDLERALDYMMSQRVTDLVIKADGLARGMGVFLPRGETDAEGIRRALLERDALGSAGRRVIIEKKLVGTEISVKMFTDGESYAMMPAVSDHKRLYDNDIGPNTGGMGAYAPTPVLTPAMAERIRAEIIGPTLDGVREIAGRFRGVLYIGVVLSPEGPVALELNVRFGDPGAQTVLPLLETDLLDVIEACVQGRLGQLDVRWREDCAVTVVLATDGYPEHSDPGIPIILAPHTPEGVHVFHAGTRYAEDGTLVTTGGRVLNVTGTGPDLDTAITLAYDTVHHVHFDGIHYRSDIGAWALWQR